MEIVFPWSRLYHFDGKRLVHNKGLSSSYDYLTIHYSGWLFDNI